VINSGLSQTDTATVRFRQLSGRESTVHEHHEVSLSG
jgi:hypothetical protein